MNSSSEYSGGFSGVAGCSNGTDYEAYKKTRLEMIGALYGNPSNVPIYL